MDEIAKEWKKAGFATDGPIDALMPASNSSEPQPPGISFPPKLAKLLAGLVAEHEETREKPAEAAAKLFIGVAPENEKFRNALRPAITQWLGVTDWFMKRAHDSGAIDDNVDKVQLRRNFELFETTLVAIEQAFSTFFATTDALDEILEEANS
jgi:hypothetical protein